MFKCNTSQRILSASGVTRGVMAGTQYGTRENSRIGDFLSSTKEMGTTIAGS